MKKKGLLLFGVVMGSCMVSVFLLLGSMGIYAERTGTGEWTLDTETEGTSSFMEWSESEDIMATAEESGAGESGLLSDKEGQDIWDKMYAEYLTQLELTEGEPGYNPNITRVESDPEYTEEYLMQAGDTGYLDGEKAGVFIMKEIHRLYPQEQLESFIIYHFQMHDYAQEDGISDSKYQWDGYLSNGKEGTDPDYISYQFTIDALTGKIRNLSRFFPYQADADYWNGTSWTEEEVKERGRQLIETYHLAEGEDLDWESVTVAVRDAEMVEEIREEMEADPEFAGSLSNVLLFYKNGQRQFFLAIDWATGELAGYDCYN